MLVQKIPGRLIITLQDIMNITGKKRSTAQRMMKEVKLAYNKSTRDFITIYEFCEYFKFKVEWVWQYMLD